MALELSVPAGRSAPPKDLEIRPKQAKAWIESLPLAQCIDSGRKIAANLAAMNRSKLELDDRLALVEVYRPIAAVAIDELDAIYSKSTLPLTPKAREALAVARSLAAELACSYKIAILEKTGRLIAFGAKKQLPPLMFRAMEYLGEGIRASYRSYTPIPAGLWKEMHALFLHAVKEGIAGEMADPETKSSIGDLYIEQLLLSLADPYRLVQGELDKVLAQIRAHRGLADLGQGRPATNPNGHFIVPCDLDRPPKPALSASDDTGGPNWRLLDANPVVEKLRQRKQAFETGNVSATTSRMIGPDGVALIAKLMVLWGDPPKRSSRRDPMDTSVAICAGLRALGHFLALAPHTDPAAEAETIRKGITVPLLSLPDDDVSKGFGVCEWEVVNQSAGGLKVRRAGVATQPISVGEVVGIKFIGRAEWTIGVVRWLTALDDGGMEFGIQFLANSARLVSVQPTVGTGTQPRLGLLLAESDGFGAADTVLTAPATYADLREFEIEDEGLVSCVRATSLVEKTARFELFQFSPS